MNIPRNNLDQDDFANPNQAAIKHHLLCALDDGGHTSELTDANYLYRAAAAVGDQLSSPWRETRKQFSETQNRRVHCNSLGFLLGGSRNNAAQNIELQPRLRQAIAAMGLQLEEIVNHEHDAGLGNGGLGRLAACFLDCCANLGLLVRDYGIRYEYGKLNCFQLNNTHPATAVPELMRLLMDKHGLLISTKFGQQRLVLKRPNDSTIRGRDLERSTDGRAVDQKVGGHPHSWLWAVFVNSNIK